MIHSLDSAFLSGLGHGRIGFHRLHFAGPHRNQEAASIEPDKKPSVFLAMDDSTLAFLDDKHRCRNGAP